MSSAAAAITRAKISLAPSVGALKSGSFGALEEIIEGARVVGFGEGEHGVHEVLIVRNLLFQFLVEHKGFTAIAVESGFTDSVRVDDFVLGKGIPLTKELVSAVFTFWPYAMEENRQLIEWMRAFNARPSTRRKIRFYGLDMMGGYVHPEGLRGISQARKPFDAALSYMQSVAPEEARLFRDRLEPELTAIYSAHYDALSADARERFTTAIADMVSLFQRRHVGWAGTSGSVAYHRAYRNALNARGIDADFRAGGFWGPPALQAAPGSVDVAQRDAELAAHLQWVLEREGVKGRVLAFAHNTHMTKDRLYASATDGPPFNANTEPPVMGMHLRESLSGEFVAIASFFGVDTQELNAGPFSTAHPEALDGPSGLLSCAGQGVCAFDLRKLARHPDIRRDLDRPWRVQFNPGPNPENPRARLAINPVESFDAVIFLGEATEARQLGAPAD